MPYKIFNFYNSPELICSFKKLVFMKELVISDKNKVKYCYHFVIVYCMDALEKWTKKLLRN